MSTTEIKEQIMKDATGTADEDEEEIATKAAATRIAADSESEEEVVIGDSKKKKAPAIPVKIINAGDFERHAKWKPEPFPEGENFNTLYAEIRARKAEEAEQEMREVLDKHVSSGLWPTGKITVVCRQAQTLRAAAVAAKDELQKMQEKSAESAAERADEKKKQVEALKGAMAVVCMGELMKSANLSKTMEERIDLGVEQAKRVFGEWAPKINSWKAPARKKAIEAADSQGISREIAQSILDAKASEESPTGVGSPSTNPKRKTLDEEPPNMELTPDDIATPHKSTINEAALSPSAPPSQSHAHKKAKAQKASPTAVEQPLAV